MLLLYVLLFLKLPEFIYRYLLVFFVICMYQVGNWTTEEVLARFLPATQEAQKHWPLLAFYHFAKYWKNIAKF